MLFKVTITLISHRGMNQTSIHEKSIFFPSNSLIIIKIIAKYPYLSKVTKGTQIQILNINEQRVL